MVRSLGRRIAAARLLQALLLSLVFSCLPAAPAAATPESMIWEEVEPLSGSGSVDDPYRYLIDVDSKVTWKQLLRNKEQGFNEEYCCYEGDELAYKWFFAADSIRTADGPYFLGVRFYDLPQTAGLPAAEQALYFSTVTKRAFPGTMALSVNVAEHFADGARLSFYHYGGYDPAVVHGAAPVAAPDEIWQVDAETALLANDLTVQEGWVTLHISGGGNFVLSQQELDFSALGGRAAQYDPRAVLDSAAELFSDPALARAVADALWVDVDDVLTQADIDLVQSLYLAELGLTDISELALINWQGLRSLTLAGNELTQLPSLNMPQLTYLDLSDNRLLSISGLAQLPALRSLLAGNNMVCVISDLSDFPTLQSIDLSHNQLAVIPSLSSDSLRYINFDGNPIDKAPSDFSRLPALETIVLPPQPQPGRWLYLVGGAVATALVAGAIIYSKKSRPKAEKNKPCRYTAAVFRLSINKWPSWLCYAVSGGDLMSIAGPFAISYGVLAHRA